MYGHNRPKTIRMLVDYRCRSPWWGCSAPMPTARAAWKPDDYRCSTWKPANTASAGAAPAA